MTIRRPIRIQETIHHRKKTMAMQLRTVIYIGHSCMFNKSHSISVLYISTLSTEALVTYTVREHHSAREIKDGSGP